MNSQNQTDDSMKCDVLSYNEKYFKDEPKLIDGEKTMDSLETTVGTFFAAFKRICHFPITTRYLTM